MTKKRFLSILCVLLVIVVSNVVIANHQFSYDDEVITLQVEVKSAESVVPAIFYNESSDEEFATENTVTAEYTNLGQWQTLTFEIPATAFCIRFDPCENGQSAEFKNLQLFYQDTVLATDGFSLDDAVYIQEESCLSGDTDVTVSSENVDPYIVWELPAETIGAVIAEAHATLHTVEKILACVLIDAIFYLAWRCRRSVADLFRDVIVSRKLIFSLSKNDFKTKYAGSVFGTFWAFVQPLVTIVLYWFVFEKGLKAGGTLSAAGVSVPYVLWLVAGLVPWFYFQDGVSSTTNVLKEYSYLVKKVVFDIEVLPVVKVISALFVHLFFLGFMIVLYACYGFIPDVYTLQVVYYSLCLIVFVLGLGYLTSALEVFFQDLAQIVNIVLQIGMWLTPIMWNIDVMGDGMPSWLVAIFKLNPLYYIVQGYRDSMIDKVWFWEHDMLTVYFWLFTILIGIAGISVFKRLKAHFADVL